MDAAVCLEDALSREIIRKLRLATEAESLEDREIVCEEIFADITGQLDADARARFGLDGEEEDDDDGEGVGGDGDGDGSAHPGSSSGAASRLPSSSGGDGASGRSGSGPPPGGHEPDGWARLEGPDGRPLAGVKVGLGAAAVPPAANSGRPPYGRNHHHHHHDADDGVLRPMGSYVSLVSAAASNRRLYPSAPPSSVGGGGRSARVSGAGPAAAARGAGAAPAAAAARPAPPPPPSVAYPTSVAFYEVLAPYYTRDSAAADTVLYFCKRLWGQPYVAPILALLLHRWLLSRPEAGGAGQRQKHVNVLVFGCRQLFNGDLHAGSRRFAPLYEAVATEWALAGVPALSPAARWQQLTAGGRCGMTGGGGGGGGLPAGFADPIITRPSFPASVSVPAFPLTPSPSVAHFGALAGLGGAGAAGVAEGGRPGTAPAAADDQERLTARLLALQQQQAASVDALPPAARRNLLALAAAFAPYYLGDEPALLRRVLDAFPSPDAPSFNSASAAAAAGGGSGGAAAAAAGVGGGGNNTPTNDNNNCAKGSSGAPTLLSDAYFDLFSSTAAEDDDGSGGPGGGGLGGADFAFCELTDLIASVRTEAAGLPRYLYALAATGAPWWGSSAGGSSAATTPHAVVALSAGGPGGGGVGSGGGLSGFGGGSGSGGGGGAGAAGARGNGGGRRRHPAADAQGGPPGRLWWGWLRQGRPTDASGGAPPSSASYPGGGASAGGGSALSSDADGCGPLGPDPLRRVRAPTRLRLQAELYALTAPGGPRRSPPAVRAAAAATLDALFPMGRRVRGLVRWASRTLHPGEWPMRGGLLLSLAGRIYSAALALVLAQVVALLALAAQLLLRGKFVVDISALHRAQQQQAARRRLLARQQRRLRAAAAAAGAGAGGAAGAGAGAGAGLGGVDGIAAAAGPDLAARGLDTGSRIHPVAGAFIKWAAPMVFPRRWLLRYTPGGGGSGGTPTAAAAAAAAAAADGTARFDSCNDLVMY